MRTRFGVDEATCTGDHSCIRLSGCPSLTVKPNPDPLRLDPVAHVNNDCVGCGVCGEVADAAVLCPSFYRADIVQNPRLVGPLARTRRRAAIARLQDARRRQPGGRGRMSERPIAVLIAALGGEGGGVLDRLDRRGGDGADLPGSGDLDPRRRAAHRRHDLLRRDVPGDARRAVRASGPLFGLYPSPGRHRSDAGFRSDRGRARARERLRHARPHHPRRGDAPHLRDRREAGDGATAASTSSRILAAARALGRRPILFDLTGDARRRATYRSTRCCSASPPRRARCRSRARHSRRRSASRASRSSRTSPPSTRAGRWARAACRADLLPRDDRARPAPGRRRERCIATVRRDFSAGGRGDRRRKA